MLTSQHTNTSTCSLTGHVWFRIHPSIVCKPHAPRALLSWLPAQVCPVKAWSGDQKAGGREKFLLWAPQQRTLLAGAGRHHWAGQTGWWQQSLLGSAALTEAGSLEKATGAGSGDLTREHKQIPNLCTSLLLWQFSRHPLLFPFYFSSPYASFVSNPLYLKHLAWFCLLDWMMPDTLLLALTTSSFLVWKLFTQTTLIFLLHSTSNLDIGKELHIPISFNTCYNT